ncbi:MAG TPA: ketoacyl-ACP synthase III [Acetivibrio sp.]|uniref:ketoacyl-ACP synthase III n=1 Tax=Acetivibrio sp. TaxID=1872092 RepID=UPI002C0B0285|nr:ketoacyl-ACP synthase III [Acetivibrio sp.]HOM01633.1 ketoacyl-ACP synthase III [Acetivibrio sp.]
MNNDIRFPEVRPLEIERYAKIVSTGVGLPDRVVTNQDIIDTYGIIATDRAVRYSVGITERRWVEDEKLEDLVAMAISQCLERAGLDIDSVDRIIYSRLLGDYQIPATSIGALRKLGAKVGIPAFDMTCACSGFMHALDLAIRYIDSGDDYVLILGGGITSKGIQIWKQPNQKTVFLFGDAVVAVLIGYSEDKHFLASYLMTNHLLYDNAFIPFGTTLFKNENVKIEPELFNMNVINGDLILQSSVEYCRMITDKLLAETNLTLDDIDYFITSDQSTKIWEAQVKELGIPFEKSLSLFHKHANTVAAMSPLILNELITSGRLKRGDLVMMHAHGAGASSGGMIFRY